MVWMVSIFLLVSTSSSLFWVFQPILTMLWSGWSRFLLLISNYSNLFSKPIRTVKSHLLQLLLSYPRHLTPFLGLLQGPSICLFIRLLLFSLCDLSKKQNPLNVKLCLHSSSFFQVRQTLHQSFSDSTRIVLSILANLNNAVVLMVSTRPPISKSSSHFINPSVTVPRAPITIGINVTFMFHSFSIPLQGGDIYLSFPILSVSLSSQLGQQSPQFS